MFSIFNKKHYFNDIEWLGVDIHSHLLPGLDDGATDLNTSIHLIKNLIELGFSKLITTPHIFTELYPNTSQSILPVLREVQDELLKQHIKVELDAGAEYMIDETFKVESDLMLSKNHILIEMSYLHEAHNIEQYIFDLQIKGYQVILAHPERYNFYHNSLHKFERYQDMGVLFQLNLLSLTGYYGKYVKITSEYLLNKSMYQLTGTDLHNDKHLQCLTKAIRNGFYHKKIGSYNFQNRELFG